LRNPKKIFLRERVARATHSANVEQLPIFSFAIGRLRAAARLKSTSLTDR
jgi:hypothetical protein